MQGADEIEHQYSLFLNERWQASGLASQDFDTEPDAFEAYNAFKQETFGAFVQSRGDTVDIDWLRGAERKRGAVESQLTQRHMGERLRNNNEKMNAQTKKTIGDILRSSDDPSVELEKVFKGDPDEDVGGLQDVGMSGARFNQLLIDEYKSVINGLTVSNGEIAPDFDKAHEILSTIDNVKTGSGFLGQTSKGRELKNDLFDLIARRQMNWESLMFSKTQREWQEQDRPLRRAMLELQGEGIPHVRTQRERAEKDYLDKEARELKGAEILAEILASPESDFEPVFEELASDRRYSSLVGTLRTALNQRLYSRDAVHMTPEMVADAGELRVSIISGEATVSDIFEGVRNRQFDQSTMGSLISDWVSSRRYRDQLDEQGSKKSKIINDGERYISRILGKKDMMGRETNPTLTVQAILQYQDAIEDFLMNNHEASAHVIRQERDRLIKEINDAPMYQPNHDHEFSGQRASMTLPGDIPHGKRNDVPDWVK